MTPRIYDCFTFLNELDLLELRLNELSPVVDFFVIVESTLTFQGAPKPLYFYENRARFADFEKRIKHVIVDDMPATDNPWDRERHQRNALKRGLVDASPDATIMICDADEIPSPAAVAELVNRQDLTYLQMKLFVYLLNYQVLEGLDAPTLAPYGGPWHEIRKIADLTAPRDGSPDNYLNAQGMSELKEHLIEDGGWHFSWLGSPDQLLQKMDSFSHTEQRYRKWHNAEELKRMIAEKRFFVSDSGISVRPIEEMPIIVQKLRNEYQQKGLLSIDAGVDAKKPAPPVRDQNMPTVKKETALQDLRCPVCAGKILTAVATKSGIDYFSCQNCSVIFARDLKSDLDQAWHDVPDISNTSPQKTRLQRIAEMLKRSPKKALDMGNGDFQFFLKRVDIECSHLKLGSVATFSAIANGSIDAIVMVEVLQKWDNPIEAIGHLVPLLSADGVIYIESSFADFLGNPARSDYVNPLIGHCCIHSRKSIDYLSKKLNLQPVWINNNVVVLRRAAEPACLSAFWN